MPGLGGQIAECFAKLIDGGVQAVIEVHERIFAPKPQPHLLARHQFRRSFQQHHQNLKWLRVQPDPNALFTQLSSSLAYLKRAETKHAICCLLRHCDGSSLAAFG